MSTHAERSSRAAQPHNDLGDLIPRPVILVGRLDVQSTTGRLATSTSPPSAESPRAAEAATEMAAPLDCKCTSFAYCSEIGVPFVTAAKERLQLDSAYRRHTTETSYAKWSWSGPRDELSHLGVMRCATSASCRGTSQQNIASQMFLQISTSRRQVSRAVAAGVSLSFPPLEYRFLLPWSLILLSQLFVDSESSPGNTSRSRRVA